MIGSRKRLSKTKRFVYVTPFGALILIMYGRFSIAKYPDLLNEHCRFVSISFELEARGLSHPTAEGFESLYLPLLQGVHVQTSMSRMVLPGYFPNGTTKSV